MSPVGAKEKWYVALTGLVPLSLKDPAHARMSWAEVFRPVGAGGEGADKVVPAMNFFGGREGSPTLL